jgi:protein-S-isoprenylcysteine O-methyltransferase Ste14
MNIKDLISLYSLSLLTFAWFAVFHSVCAHEWFKDLLAKLTGKFFVKYFWRIIYCSASYLMLYHAFGFVTFERIQQFNLPIFNYPLPVWNTLIILHLIGVAVMYFAFIKSDYLEFLGLKQMFQGFGKMLGIWKEPEDLKLFGTDRLEITGIYRLVRHPMLAGGLLFTLTLPPTINNSVYSLFLIIYIYIGVYFEERRLIKVFGDDYRQYIKDVSAFVPNLKSIRGLFS